MPTDVEREVGIMRIAIGFEYLLTGLGIEYKDDPHMRDTPMRAAKAWYDEICAGITGDPPKITTFPSKSDNMVILRDIPVRSVCSHHLLPFIGSACVAYIPGDGKILGLSKLSRIVNYHSRRPQVQEDLTEQIADHVLSLITRVEEERTWVDDTSAGHYNIKRIEQAGVGVVVRASHMCMLLRGVNHAADMVTSSLRGRFLESGLRSEFLALADI